VEGRGARLRRGQTARPGENRLVWLTPAPANNTWVIAIRHDLPGFPPRRCLGDLAGYLAKGGRFKLAASAEFVESAAALPAFEETYGFQLRSDQLLTLSGGNTAATLRAAAEGTSGVNAAMAYGHRRELAALGLTALCDDKGAQIVYAPAPVAREAILQRQPENRDRARPGVRLAVADHFAGVECPHRRGREEAGTVARDYLKARRFLP